MEALRGNNGFTLDIWSMLYDYMAQDFFIRKDFLGNFLNGKSLRTWGTVLDEDVSEMGRNVFPRHNCPSLRCLHRICVKLPHFTSRRLSNSTLSCYTKVHFHTETLHSRK